MQVLTDIIMLNADCKGNGGGSIVDVLSASN